MFVVRQKTYSLDFNGLIPKDKYKHCESKGLRILFSTFVMSGSTLIPRTSGNDNL